MTDDQAGKPDEKKNADKDAGQPDKPPADPPADPAAAKRRKIKVLLILAAVFLVVAIIAFFYWLHARHYESTDDASIDGFVAQVAPQVAGPVIRLAVADNQEVAKGQLLFQIDPRDEQVRLRQAQAQALQAAAQIQTARANAEKSQNDLRRYRQTDARAVSRQQLDSATAQADSDAATLEAAKASLAAAQATVANAALQLSYTFVKAPQAGRVTRRTVDVGNYLTAGEAALAIVSDELWVTANFKETQLDLMKQGQHVDIKVDAYPDATITGHVQSVQSGTGSVFSSLPAENATGNYVKIVQRVPVKIVIDRIKHKRDREVHLAPGLSVVPRVTVR